MFKLPNFLYIEDKDNYDYRRGYRHLNSFEKGQKILVISKHLTNDCKKIYVCFDKGNGDPLHEFGKIYCWIFFTEELAKFKYYEHKENDKYSDLKFPSEYYIVDRFTR
jgi:hypothetical protein